MTLEQTIRALGGPQRVRNLMNLVVSRSAVDQWMREMRPVPPRYHAEIYRLCDRAKIPRPVLVVGVKTGRRKKAAT